MARIPKVIAGVKVPKHLRAPAETLLDLASHPLVSDTLAAGLVAGSAALAEGKARPDVGKAAGLGAAAAAVKASDGARRIGVAIAIAATQVAASRLAKTKRGKGKRNKKQG